MATSHGSATFTMQVAASNQGTFLRRTLDSYVPGQRAKIYLDGHYAGTWMNTGYSAGAGSTGTGAAGGRRTTRCAPG